MRGSKRSFLQYLRVLWKEASSTFNRASCESLTKLSHENNLPMDINSCITHQALYKENPLLSSISTSSRRRVSSPHSSRKPSSFPSPIFTQNHQNTIPCKTNAYKTTPPTFRRRIFSSSSSHPATSTETYDDGMDAAPVANTLLQEDNSSLSKESQLLEISGTVQRITYRSIDNGYTVLRLTVDSESEHKIQDRSPSTSAAIAKASKATSALDSNGSTNRKVSRKQQQKNSKTVTVIGTLPHVVTGQPLKLSGSWTVHQQYGEQFRVAHVEELSPEEGNIDVKAYLASGIIPGVGPVTADAMVKRWGSNIISILDSDDAVSMLCQCSGIKQGKAEKIKEGWDAGKDAREGSSFLRDAGVPIVIAQRIAESLGKKTKEIVSRDPYSVLGAFGLSLKKADIVATQMDAPSSLVSRAAAALEHCLAMAAGGEGHTFLPWVELEKQAKAFLEELSVQHGNDWPYPDLLHLVAMHMHNQGTLIAEPAFTVPNTASHTESTPPSPSPSSSASAFLASVAALPSLTDSPHKLEDIKVAISQRLSSATPQQVSSIVAEYGIDSIHTLDQPPAAAVRALIRCKRIGPKTAEKLKAQWDATALETNTTPNAQQSLSAAPKQTSSQSSIASPQYGLQMSDIMDAPPVVAFKWSSDVRCYLPRLHAAESAIATCATEKASLAGPIKDLRKARIRNWIAKNQENNGMELSEGQRAAIEAASDAPILVITGGPGCGKTTVVQAIVKLWSAQKKFVHICAPTGRAAQRMGVIQNIEPSTIHRLLRYQPRGRRAGNVAASLALGGSDSDADDIGSGAGSKGDGDAADDFTRDDLGGGFFEIGPSNQLNSDAVLVDEASMLSVPLASALMQALKPKTQLILVGDVDQLPPVGPGGVLHSLIASGAVPVIDLREVFRQAARSSIVTSALSVRQGITPRLHVIHPESEELARPPMDALLVKAPSAESVPLLVYKTVGALAGASGFAEGDLQVITPMRKGPAGSIALNPRLQALLNPPSPEKQEISRSPSIASIDRNKEDKVFRVGDRVLQLINNYEKDVFNGDQGYIVHANKEKRLVVVEFPMTSIKASTASPSMGGLQKEAGQYRDQGSAAANSRRVEYQGMELSQLELAYAITVHKAQGGEARHVVLALSPQHGRMLTRRLLYTGLTRARELLITVAPESDHINPIAVAVATEESDARLSSLKIRLERAAQEAELRRYEPVIYSNEEEVLHHALVLQGQNDVVVRQHTYVDREIQQQQQQQQQVEKVEISNKLTDTASKVAHVTMRDMLCMLCQELDIDDETTRHLISLPSMNASAPLNGVDMVRSHVVRVQQACDARGLASVSDVMRHVPLLVFASPEYLERSLVFSEKLGPLYDSSSGGGQESLVDQLRKLKGVYQGE